LCGWLAVTNVDNVIRARWQDLMDLLIAMAAEAAAAAASSWSIIGSVVGGAAFALTLAKAIGVWGKVGSAHTTAWNAAQGLVGVMAGYLGGIEDLNVHALPTASYDHPGV